MSNTATNPKQFSVGDFFIMTRYHPPVGRQRRGHSEYFYLSKCHTWKAEQSWKKGEMLVKNYKSGEVFIVVGGLADCVAKINTMSN